MALHGLFPLLRDHPAYGRLVEELDAHGRGAISAGATGAPLLISALYRDLNRPMMVIAPRLDDTRRVMDMMQVCLGSGAPLFPLPEPDVLPFERMAVDVSTSNQRLMAMDALSNRPTANRSTGAPPIIVASMAAALRKTMAVDTFRGAAMTLSRGQSFRIRDVTAQWVGLGYRREESVEIPGTFSVRGGIVDVFSPASGLPVRLDLWGDEIDTIHEFEPTTQRSVRAVESVRVIPAQETLPLHTNRDRTADLISQLNFAECIPSVANRIQDELANLFIERKAEDLAYYHGLFNQSSGLDYLGGDGVVVFLRESEARQEALNLEGHAAEMQRDRVERGELPAGFPTPHLRWDDFAQGLEGLTVLDVNRWKEREGGFNFLTAPSFYGQMDRFTDYLRGELRGGKSVVATSRHARRLSEILTEADIGSVLTEAMDESPPPGTVTIVPGSLEQGWRLRLAQGELLLLTDLEVFGTVKERRSRPRRPFRKALHLSQLIPGSYVVHEDHGVARFAGTTSMETAGETREYLTLEYAESDKLYLPTDHLDRISPYVGSDDRPPTLTRLSSAEWSRAKERVKASTQELAKDLLGLYANRQVAQGHAFSADVVWQQEMEDAFPYEETPDQARVIDEIKDDMESVKPMDRLVCGDVGYGKTEVALRAAFKTVNDGMQVALLVPTTILAQQHYATFANRLSPYAVRVEVLSRFRTPKEQREVIEDLKNGRVDIVIGTHRLIQKDVKFRNLGLVIVDEEQRFGVSHKERLKRMKKEVDFLTLSATPIPRTLYMALSGVRDMSAIDTPPEDRYPIKTYVGEYSERLVKEAVRRELDRGGQVFYLHNRVMSIQRVAGNLAKLAPQARIAVAHGRMSEARLEEVMLAFSEGEYNVLVCTTIIESGLDIPNANTLIIDRADRFGLAQLYQLRGRIGRSSARAYSYLLAPKGKRITPEAEKRLQAILEASELGSGFRVAMRDLEIRGAGNILGGEQSGHIHAIGFELYSKLLNQAVSELRARNEGVPPPNSEEQREVRVDLPAAAFIPQDYISHLPVRLAVYRRMMNLSGPEDLDDMRSELRDRFGHMPEEVSNLLYALSLKGLAKGLGIESITSSDNDITLNLKDPVGGARLALERSLGGWANVGNKQIRLNRARMGLRWQEILGDTLRKLGEFRERMRTLTLAAVSR